MWSRTEVLVLTGAAVVIAAACVVMFCVGWLAGAVASTAMLLFAVLETLLLTHLVRHG